MPKERSKSEKQRHWELGQEGEKWVAKLFTESGFIVECLNIPLYDDDGELMHFLDIPESQKRCPDFEVKDPVGTRWYVDAKYSTTGKIYYRNLERQLRIYPQTRYVVICDARKDMMRALTDASVRNKERVMVGFPVEKIWSQIRRETRLRVEEEIRDKRPFKKIKEKYM